MSERNIEDIIGSLYDMVQDARAMPLAADKCILERDRVLEYTVYSFSSADSKRLLCIRHRFRLGGDET